MRSLLVLGALLVFGAGAPLVLTPRRTDELFVFPITPPVTAAFLGANYWAAGVIELLSARRRLWAHARAPLLGVLVFTALTALISLRNLARYDLHAAPAWIWLGVYTLFPIAIVGVWLHQRRAPGTDPPQRVPLPSALRLVLGLLGAMLLAGGVALTIYPQQAGASWAWELTPPGAAYRTAGATSLEPYVGCWLIGIGVVGVSALREDDAVRLVPVFAGSIVLAMLQMLTLARFGAAVDWSRPGAWVLAAAIAAFATSGAWGLFLAWPGDSRQRSAHSA